MTVGDKEYIGDGLFCVFNDKQFIFISEEENKIHKFRLEDKGIISLLRFIERKWKVEIKVQVRH